MGDARLRELERRWRETRDAEDEAAYLTERLRAGEVSAAQVELWAYCGRPGAVLVTPQAATHRSPAVALERWVHGLERWGRRPCAAAALGALPLVWPLLAEGALGFHEYRPWSAERLAQLGAVRALAEEWLRQPAETTASRLAEQRWLANAHTPSPDLPRPVWRRQSASKVFRRALDTIVEETYATSAANCLNTANDVVPVAELARAARDAVVSLVL